MERSPCSIDVILISDAKDRRLNDMTQRAIDSVGSGCNIIIVESNKLVNYDNALTFHPNTPFNYNHYLNIGAKYGKGDFIFFGNNDLIFRKNWNIELVNAMRKHNVVSASPICPRIGSFLKINSDSESLFGYDIMYRFCGWAFMWTREFYSKTGGLDEGFTFWCSDNVVTEQLINANEKHILVTSSIVEHLGSATLKTLYCEIVKNYTVDEVEKFNKRFDKNLWDSPHLK